WPSSLAAMAKPGFAGGWAANIALEVKFSTRRTIQVASTAPMILLSSKESILAQAPGRKGSKKGVKGAAGRPRTAQDSPIAAHPEQAGDIGLPCLWQPV